MIIIHVYFDLKQTKENPLPVDLEELLVKSTVPFLEKLNAYGCHAILDATPPPPYVYMFTHTLPTFRKLGLEEEAIYQMMVLNPRRILPIQAD